MSTKQIRDVERLAEPFKSKVKAWLKENPEVFVVETFRTAERQAMLVKQGASWVKVSNHQSGRAIDIAYRGPQLYPSKGNPCWKKLSDSAKKHGINSGMSLWNDDFPHFQDDGSPYQSPKLTTMTEFQLKLLNSVISLISSAWGILPEQFRPVLEQANKQLKEMRAEMGA